MFENRHKFLCALEELLDSENQILSGTIEIDETFELKSNKGTRNISRKGSQKRRGLQSIEEYPMNKYVSLPQRIEMDMRYLKWLVLENRPLKSILKILL